MQEQVLSWINGLRSASTEYINECDQNLYQFSQNPSNLQCFIEIIKENDDFYIVNASLHILRSSLNRYSQGFPSEYAMQLLNSVLEEFSKNFDFTLIYIYKSIIKLLTFLANEENFPDLLFSCFLQSQKSNHIAAVILINIVLKTVELDNSIENLNTTFFQYSYNFLQEILSIESSEYKAYFLSYTLSNLEQLSLIIGEKILNIDIIEPFIDLFKDSDISIKTYRKLWNSVARIFNFFNQFATKSQFLVLLVQYASSIPDPAYLYCLIHQFLPFFKEKSIPFDFIKLFINCEISVCVRCTTDINNHYFDKDLIKSAITYYNSPDEIYEIFNHIVLMIHNGVKSNSIFIVFYGYIIKACNHIVSVEYRDLIQFFDEFFNEEAGPNYVLACLQAFSYLLKSTFNNTKELINYYFDRILACTLSNVPKIRSSSFFILNSINIDVNLDNRLKISKSVVENQDKYLGNSPYDFFIMLVICTNFNLPIPESYYEACINDILIPLVKEDLGYLKYLAGLISSNEFWIEPYMQLLGPFFDTQIDEEISKVVDGSFSRNNNLESIINFFSLLLDNYGEVFFNLAQVYILKLCNLFFKIEEIDIELFTYLTKRLSFALKYLTNVEECDKLTSCLFKFVLRTNFSGFRIAYPILSETICHNSAELATSIIGQIIQIIQTNENDSYINSCFRILGESAQNPNFTEVQLSELSQFMRQYCNDVVLKEQVFAYFFVQLGKMLYLFPDFLDWYQYLFSNIELLGRNKLILYSFYYNCIFKYLCDDKIVPSHNMDNMIAELSIQIFNDPKIMNDFKACSIINLSILIEKGRSPIAIQFFKENFVNFIQYLKDNDNPFSSHSAVIILNAAICINDIEFDPEMLAYCCDKFPDDIEFDVNLFFIKYSIMIMNEENKCPYAPHLELKILDSFFQYIKKSYQRIRQINNNWFEKLIQCFKFLAEKNHDYVQQKINELVDYPSAQKRIINILNPPENKQVA